MNFCLKIFQDCPIQLSLFKTIFALMVTHLFFALTASEMGLSPTILALIVVSSIVFIVGFAKSSRENEYKKLMDSFIERKEESD